MAEHYPRGTLEITAWCGVCQCFTQHRVDHPPEGSKGGGRKGPCLEHAPSVNDRGESKTQEARRLKREKEEKNLRLFE